MEPSPLLERLERMDMSKLEEPEEKLSDLPKELWREAWRIISVYREELGDYETDPEDMFKQAGLTRRSLLEGLERKKKE